MLNTIYGLATTDRADGEVPEKPVKRLKQFLEYLSDRGYKISPEYNLVQVAVDKFISKLNLMSVEKSEAPNNVTGLVQ